MNTPYADEPKNFSYPSNIAKIPYASFLKIKKYAYDEGMATVGKEQNDAIGAFQDSTLMKNITDGLADRAQDIFSDGTGGQSLMTLDDEDAIQQARNRSQTLQNRLSMWGLIKPWADTRTDEQVLDSEFKVDKNWLGQGGDTVTMRDLLEQKNDAIDFNNAGYKQSYVDLAMPNEFQYDYGANWNNTFKLGTMALFADDPGRMAGILVGGGTIGGVIGGLSTTLAAPTVTKIRIVQSSIAAGSRTITAEITWDEKVTVAGTPQVVIANGNQGSGSGRGPHTLSYTATGSTANRKRFTVASQTVAEDDVLTLGGSNISLNSGTITDTADGSTAASLVLSGLTAVTLTVVA